MNRSRPPATPWGRLLAWSSLPLLLLGLTASSSAGDPPAPLDLRDFVVTFVDDFKTLDITANGPGSRWIAHTPWHGDFGDAAFADPGPDGPFAPSAEGLTITARRDAAGRWRSGLIASMDRDGEGQQGFAQRYGYFEMRARLPAGPGVWPAFWLIGVDKSQAASEIDVLEYFGAFPDYMHSWMHLFVDGKDTLQKDNLHKIEAGSLTDRFNDYGVLVEPDRTRFYLNRQPIWTMATPDAYRQPMYMLADLALGGGWPTDKLTSPAVMTIARIQVFQDKRWLSSMQKVDGRSGRSEGVIR